MLGFEKEMRSWSPSLICCVLTHSLQLKDILFYFLPDLFILVVDRGAMNALILIDGLSVSFHSH